MRAGSLMTSDASNKQIVLVVEDDPMLRGILAEALAGEGLVVLTAATGRKHWPSPAR